MCVTIGIDPNEFWRNTMRKNSMIALHREKSEESESLRNRKVEFAIYDSSINDMNGKKNYPGVKKPSDLYKLRSDIEAEKEEIKRIKESQPTKEEFFELLKKRGIKTE